MIGTYSPAPTPAAKGFGAHAWSEKDGGAAGLELDFHSHALDWAEDAFMILGSESFWEALPDDDQVAGLTHQVLLDKNKSAPAQSAPECAAERLLQRAAATRKGAVEDRAVTVMTFAWCSDLVGDKTPGIVRIVADQAPPSAPCSPGGRSWTLSPEREPEDYGDMFAPPDPTSAPSDSVDEMFAAPLAAAASGDANLNASLPQDKRRDGKRDRSRSRDRMPLRLAEDEGLDSMFPEPSTPTSEPENGLQDMSASAVAAGHTHEGSDAALAPMSGPPSELDDMFAAFCEEVGGIGSDP